MGTEPHVLLDGKYTPATQIDSGKHRYLGMFRPPTNWMDGANSYCICACGHTVKYREEGRTHYLRGCMDVPQYVSLATEADATAGRG